MYTAEIIAIGSELLTPYRTDTNSLWLTDELNNLGISVTRKHIIGDDKAALCDLLKQAGERSDFVITTGGLGPTFDDITREALSCALGVELEYKEEIFSWVAGFYKKRGRVPTENNRRQAYVPVGGNYHYNAVGTAPGLSFRSGNCTYALLPGPPAEMQHLFPQMADTLFDGIELNRVFTRKFKMAHIPESLAEEKLSALKLPANAEWSILAAYGQVEAHFRVLTNEVSKAEAVFEDILRQMEALVGNHMFGVDDDSLESVVGKILTENKHTLAVAESCTGGWLAQRLTDISGSSAYFTLGVVSYANEAKMNILGVKEDTLIAHGAVSRETALEMAYGVRARGGTDVSAAITGIAGPTGGTETKPVGTVYIAVVDSDGNGHCYRFLFGGGREKIRLQATQSALDMIRLLYRKTQFESSFVVHEN